MSMISFKSYLDEVFKKPNVLQGLVSKRARRAREVHDERNSPNRKLQVKWKEKEANLNKDMGWNPNDEGNNLRVRTTVLP